MKLWTRSFSFFLACLIVFTSAPEIFAKVYDVGTAEEMTNSWNTAASDWSSDNIFNMTNNIDMGGQTLIADNSENYTVNGNGYTLTDFSVISKSNSTSEAIQPDVTINANVSGNSDGIAALTAAGTVDVVVNGNVTAKGGADGIVASGGADVTVTGNVNSYGDSYITENSTVTIEGNYTSDESGLLIDNSKLTVQGDVSVGENVSIQNKSNVTVHGDISCQSDTGTIQNNSIYVTGGSNLWVGTTLEANGLHIFGNSKVDAPFVEADIVNVGVLDFGTSTDKSQLLAHSISDDTGDALLRTGGFSTASFTGSIEDVYAYENSRVEVNASAKDVEVYDNAIVVTNKATSAVVHTAPSPDSGNSGSDGADNGAGNTRYSDIIAMCRSYTEGTELKKQTSDLLNLLSKVSIDIADELSIPAAAVTALFDHENINLDSYMSSRFQTLDMYNQDLFHDTSVANFKNAEKLNTYYIARYEEALALALEDLYNSQFAQDSEEDLETIENLLKCGSNSVDALKGMDFSGKEMEYLEKALEDKNFSAAEIVEFLKTFRHKENDPGVFLEAQRIKEMSDMWADVAKDVELAGKLAEAGMTIYDFAAPYLRDYTRSVKFLDEMLSSHALSPEMFAAAVELRLQLTDKFKGSLNQGVDLIKEKSIDVIKKMWGPLAAGQAAIDVVGLITGGTKDAKDNQNGAALISLANEIYYVFEGTIKNVQNGDTSKEAVEMVQISYTVLTNALEEMCDIMKNIGNRDQEKYYKSISNKLSSMALGDYIGLVK